MFSIKISPGPKIEIMKIIRQASTQKVDLQWKNPDCQKKQDD
jgi:hypothetical protein